MDLRKLQKTLSKALMDKHPGAAVSLSIKVELNSHYIREAASIHGWWKYDDISLNQSEHGSSIYIHEKKGLQNAVNEFYKQLNISDKPKLVLADPDVFDETLPETLHRKFEGFFGKRKGVKLSEVVSINWDYFNLKVGMTDNTRREINALVEKYDYDKIFILS